MAKINGDEITISKEELAKIFATLITTGVLATLSLSKAERQKALTSITKETIEEMKNDIMGDIEEQFNNEDGILGAYDEVLLTLDETKAEVLLEINDNSDKEDETLEHLEEEELEQKPSQHLTITEE